MAVAVTNYTDSDKIRGLLGLTDNELSDSQVTNSMMTEALLSDLEDWLPTHATVYTDGITGTPTNTQLNDLRNLQLYSAYYCASRIDIIQLYVPQSLTNGKDAFKRFEGIDFEELGATLLQAAKGYQEKLEISVNEGVAVARPKLAGLSSPDYDPVTNT